MADPFDFYADIASVTKSDVGMTLILLRSLPAPANRDGVLTGPNEVQEGVQPVAAELVARIRMTPVFAAQLRDLLVRILETADHDAGRVVDQTG